jgi:anti-sigma B factor antagonist
MADLSVQREGGPQVAPLLRVERIVEGDVVILRASGEIDLSTTPLLAERFDQEEVRTDVPLVVDLTGVDFLASSGLGLLAERSQRYAERGARLTVVAAHRAVLRSIELTGLSEIITVVSSVEEAVARLS